MVDALRVMSPNLYKMQIIQVLKKIINNHILVIQIRLHVGRLLVEIIPLRQIMPLSRLHNNNLAIQKLIIIYQGIRNCSMDKISLLGRI